MNSRKHTSLSTSAPETTTGSNIPADASVEKVIAGTDEDLTVVISDKTNKLLDTDGNVNQELTKYDSVGTRAPGLRTRRATRITETRSRRSWA